MPDDPDPTLPPPREPVVHVPEPLLGPEVTFALGMLRLRVAGLERLVRDLQARLAALESRLPPG